MNTSDYAMAGIFVGFGLWWFLFPRTVLSFYAWFHSTQIKDTNPTAIRVVGLGWIVLVLAITWFSFRN